MGRADGNGEPSGLRLTDEEVRRVRHDLRTPLTIVAGFAEVLASERPITDESRREYAGRIQAAANELRAMLDALLEEPTHQAPRR